MSAGLAAWPNGEPKYPQRDFQNPPLDSRALAIVVNERAAGARIPPRNRDVTNTKFNESEWNKYRRRRCDLEPAAISLRRGGNG
jgi:hypothetical protein